MLDKLFNPYLLCALFASCVTGSIVSSHYEGKIAELELSVAVAKAEQGREDYAKLVEAQNFIDDYRRSAVDLNAELERVRRAAAGRVRETESLACRDALAANARCERLLLEATALLSEGGRLLQENAAKHDAVVRVRE